MIVASSPKSIPVFRSQNFLAFGKAPPRELQRQLLLQPSKIYLDSNVQALNGYEWITSGFQCQDAQENRLQARFSRFVQPPNAALNNRGVPMKIRQGALPRG